MNNSWKIYYGTNRTEIDKPTSQILLLIESGIPADRHMKMNLHQWLLSDAADDDRTGIADSQSIQAPVFCKKKRTFTSSKLNEDERMKNTLFHLHLIKNLFRCHLLYPEQMTCQSLNGMFMLTTAWGNVINKRLPLTHIKLFSSLLPVENMCWTILRYHVSIHCHLQNPRFCNIHLRIGGHFWFYQPI